MDFFLNALALFMAITVVLMCLFGLIFLTTRFFVGCWELARGFVVFLHEVRRSFRRSRIWR